MSKYTTLKLTLFLLALLALPKSMAGAELKYGEKTWPLTAEYQQAVSVPQVRNDFSVVDLATAALTGKSTMPTEKLLSPAMAAQIEQAAAEINQEPKSAKLVIQDFTAKEFEPGQLGQALDIFELRKRIMTEESESYEVPVLISYPDKTLADTNDLGITELVAEGKSDFSGSTNARIHNIRVGSGRFNGVILKPNEEFSFNKYLGEVDGEHGFLPELVIKRDGVIPEFGGGLCQVSSTSFRAAMNAGVNITARRNHSFAVHYYSPQGSDATIYPGVQDFKFVNDTPGHMLIWTRLDVPNRKLYFDYYGTKDDRQIVLDGPYQYDKKTNGAMKATWTKKVTMNGQTSEQVFNSTYLPPALFQPKPATPPAETPPVAQPVPAPEPLPAPVPPPPPPII